MEMINTRFSLSKEIFCSPYGDGLVKGLTVSYIVKFLENEDFEYYEVNGFQSVAFCLLIHYGFTLAEAAVAVPELKEHLDSITKNIEFLVNNDFLDVNHRILKQVIPAEIMATLKPGSIEAGELKKGNFDDFLDLDIDIHAYATGCCGCASSC